MKFLLNLIWLIFGGIITAIGYAFGGLVLCITIIGIPFGIQCFKLAGLALWPFGKQVVNDPKASHGLSLIMNIIWILVGGFAVVLNHIVMGVILFITIIGIPWGKQHFKMIEISLMPFGKRIVDEYSS